MSERKQTAAENTAAVEKTGAVDSQAYSDNLSFLSDMAKYEGNLGESKADRADAVTDFLNRIPAARGLMVPIADFANTRAALENPKSGAGIIFAAVKAALN